MSESIVYSERLLPRVWVWLGAYAFAAMIGLGYGAALGPAFGWGAGAIASAIATFALWITSLRISVTTEEVSVGHVSLPTQWIGKVAELTPKQQVAAGRDAAFFVIRPLTTKHSVLIEVTDPIDPYPYWLISTKHPDQFVSALLAVRAGASEGVPSSLG